VFGGTGPAGERWAVKAVDKRSLQPQDMKYLQSEVKATQHCAHPNVVEMVSCEETDLAVVMCMERCDGGEVLDRLEKLDIYSEYEAAKVIKSLCLAMQHVHMCGVIHRDVKAENILYIDRECTEIKVCDFGLAAFCQLGDGIDDGRLVGSPHYLAPEAIRRKPYRHAGDVWSVGIIMCFLLSGTVPFDDDDSRLDAGDYQRLFNKIVTQPWRLELPQDLHLTAGAEDLLSKMLHKSDADRISFRGCAKPSMDKFGSNCGQQTTQKRACRLSR